MNCTVEQVAKKVSKTVSNVKCRIQRKKKLEKEIKHIYMRLDDLDNSINILKEEIEQLSNTQDKIGNQWVEVIEDYTELSDLVYSLLEYD